MDLSSSRHARPRKQRDWLGVRDSFLGQYGATMGDQLFLGNNAKENIKIILNEFAGLTPVMVCGMYEDTIEQRLPGLSPFDQERLELALNFTRTCMGFDEAYPNADPTPTEGIRIIPRRSRSLARSVARDSYEWCLSFSHIYVLCPNCTFRGHLSYSQNVLFVSFVSYYALTHSYTLTHTHTCPQTLV